MVGKTHSGKSTFARMLENALPDFAILETDPIGLFLKESFSKASKLHDEIQGDFSGTTLKFEVFETILAHTLLHKQNIILANSNMWRDGRARIFQKIYDAGYQSVIVHMNIPEQELLNRVEKSDRPTDVLTTSKNFTELVIKQREFMALPTSNESDHFFEIGDVGEIESVIKKINTTLFK